MNKVVRLKDDTIHILQSDEEVINLIEEYMGRDIAKMIEENKCETCDYCDAVDRIKNIVSFV